MLKFKRPIQDPANDPGRQSFAGKAGKREVPASSTWSALDKAPVSRRWKAVPQNGNARNENSERGDLPSVAHVRPRAHTHARAGRTGNTRRAGGGEFRNSFELVLPAEVPVSGDR